MTIKKLPSLKSREVISALEKLGFQKDRQKGSHLIMYNNFTKRRTTVPIHKGKDVKKSLLKGIIEEDVGITIDEFLKILRK
jgi:predicted RNA binding protein YcfA (HicA-like mRNA interferase family)